MKNKISIHTILEQKKKNTKNYLTLIYLNRSLNSTVSLNSSIINYVLNFAIISLLICKIKSLLEYYLSFSIFYFCEISSFILSQNMVVIIFIIENTCFMVAMKVRRISTSKTTL